MKNSLALAPHRNIVRAELVGVRLDKSLVRG
jgi:hypothetical protein